MTVSYTRRRNCVTCREPFAVDPQRPNTRICTPCAATHPDRRVRERLTTPPRNPTPIQRGPNSPEGVAMRSLVSPPGRWVKRAACRPEVAEWYWPLPGQSDGPDIHRALKICSHCPVIRDCGKWAIENRQVDGVWGGMRPRALRRLVERQIGVSPC